MAPGLTVVDVVHAELDDAEGRLVVGLLRGGQERPRGRGDVRDDGDGRLVAGSGDSRAHREMQLERGLVGRGLPGNDVQRLPRLEVALECLERGLPRRGAEVDHDVPRRGGDVAGAGAGGRDTRFDREEVRVDHGTLATLDVGKDQRLFVDALLLDGGLDVLDRRTEEGGQAALLNTEGFRLRGVRDHAGKVDLLVLKRFELVGREPADGGVGQSAPARVGDIDQARETGGSEWHCVTFCWWLQATTLFRSAKAGRFRRISAVFLANPAKVFTSRRNEKAPGRFQPGARTHDTHREIRYRALRGSTRSPARWRGRRGRRPGLASCAPAPASAWAPSPRAGRRRPLPAARTPSS